MNRARQIGVKDGRALQDADQKEIPGRVIAFNLMAELNDALLDLGFEKKRAKRHLP